MLEPYRDKRTVELLWHGIWAYVLHHRIDVMFGCASLEGTDPDAHRAAAELPAPPRARAAGVAGARPCRAGTCRMDRLPAAAIDAARRCAPAAADQGLSAGRRDLSATAR